jgi:hypothetical protein
MPLRMARSNRILLANCQAHSDSLHFMNYALAILAGMLGALLGWLLTGALAAWVAGLFGMSDFEGGRGMFAFLAVGPLGGLLCMILSVWLVLRRRHGRAPLAPALARLAAVLGAIAVITAAGIWLRLRMVDTYTDSLPPVLEFEIRMPGTLAVTDRSALRVELHTDRNVDEGRLTYDWRAADGGQQVIAGSVPLSFKTSSRLLVVSLPGQPTRLFRLALARDPSSTAAFGTWRRPDHVHGDGGGAVQPAAADDAVALRYRVQAPGE